MNNLKRVLSIVMMLARLVPLAVVGSYADEYRQNYRSLGRDQDRRF